MTDGSHRWPRLSYADWSDAALTLHLWTQVVGKIRLAADALAQSQLARPLLS